MKEIDVRDCPLNPLAAFSEDGFVDRDLVEFNYPKRDFHTMYIGEIVKVLVRE